MEHFFPNAQRAWNRRPHRNHCRRNYLYDYGLHFSSQSCYAGARRRGDGFRRRIYSLPPWRRLPPSIFNGISGQPSLRAVCRNGIKRLFCLYGMRQYGIQLGGSVNRCICRGYYLHSSLPDTGKRSSLQRHSCHVKIAVAVGIGLFITFIGLQNAHIVVASSTLVSLIFLPGLYDSRNLLLRRHYRASGPYRHYYYFRAPHQEGKGKYPDWYSGHLGDLE